MQIFGSILRHLWKTVDCNTWPPRPRQVDEETVNLVGGRLLRALKSPTDKLVFEQAWQHEGKHNCFNKIKDKKTSNIFTVSEAMKFKKNLNYFFSW